MASKIETPETRLGSREVHDTTGHRIGAGKYKIHVICHRFRRQKIQATIILFNGRVFDK
jgi:hypothetical protein